MSYLDNLNEAQRRAVESIEGPNLIVAGAGSGKTRVISYRVANLLGQGVDPFKILVLTFTNKAAKEMKERIIKLIGDEAKNIWIGTFHAIFNKILRIEAAHINYTSGFSIYDQDDVKSIIKGIIVKEMKLNDKLYNPNFIASHISLSKNNLISAHDYAANEQLNNLNRMNGRPLISNIYKQYTQHCFKSDAMDFDDLLMYTYKLFDENNLILHKYQTRFDYLLVDEFQDTNKVQYHIIRLLSSIHRNLCCVGDDDQSIYSFRGANVKNILFFQKDYPDRKIFKLEQNYRSTQTIVNAANSVIKKNVNKIDKKVFSKASVGNKIIVYEALTENEEGRIVVNHIERLQYKDKQPYNNFCILYRTNAQSRAFEESLRRKNIPYKVFGGLSFYQRKEVKDMLAYLKVCVNPKDEQSFRRLINFSGNGIGQSSIDKLLVVSREEDKPLWEIIKRATLYTPALRALKSLQNFADMIQSFMDYSKTNDAYKLGEYITEQTKIITTLQQEDSIDGKARCENIKSLLNSIKEFIEQGKANQSQVDVGSFLNEVALLTDADKKDTLTDYVSLMTVHNAKGLEFEHVFVVGLEENLFPSINALDSQEGLEEERRLMYVALTRAKRTLTLSFAKTRYKWGNLIHSTLSRFLKEIDDRCIEVLSKAISNNNEESIKKNIYKTYVPHSSKSHYKHRISENFKIVEPQLIKEGFEVEHEKFGIGKVQLLEGDEPNIKAIIDFYQVGKKNILLKFSKLSLYK